MNSHKHSLLPSLFFVLLWPLPGLAQLDDDEQALLDLYGDEDTISIATGNKQSIAKAPAVATVITARDIRALGATDIDQVLETVPGLHVAAKPFGYDPIYTFRGIISEYNPQVLMLVNGIPLSNLFNGDRNLIWGGMPVNAISRIEVIRGPGSALYGADAFAGVINIITKSRKDIQKTEVGFRAGSFDTLDTWLLHGTEWGEFDIAFMLEYHESDGQNEKITADAQTGLDSALGTSASLAPGEVNLSRENLDLRLDIQRDLWQLRAGLQRRRDWGNGAGVADALDPHNRYNSDRWNIDISYHNPEFRKHWDVSAQVSYLDTSQEVDKDLIIFPSGVNLGAGVYPEGFIGNPEVFERHTRANTSVSYSGYERHQVRAGAGYYYGDLYKVQESKNFGLDPATGLPLSAGAALVDVSDTPYIFLRETDRKNYFLFVQDVWQFADDWEVTAGLRYDDYSDFGSTTNPRLALVWSTRRDLTTKLLYGQAFRSPAFTETRAINNPVVLGNPNLDPETLESYELAFDYRPSETLRLSLNLFHYTWDDIIEYVPDPSALTSTTQNAGEQVGDGGEIEINWALNKQLQLTANYALQHAEEDKTNIDAREAPQQQFYLGLDWQFFDIWRLNTHLNWVLDRPREAGDSRSEIDDYRLVNLTLQRQSRDGHWGLALSVRNLFDSDARESSPWSSPAAGIPDDLPLARRNFFGEIQYRF